MSGSREILKSLLPTEGNNGIIYLLGSAGIAGAVYLLYHFRGRQPRAGYEQKISFSPETGEAKMEEKLVTTARSVARGNQVTGGNLDNRSLGQHPESEATSNTVRNGNLANNALQTGPISDAALPTVLEQTNPRGRSDHPDSQSGENPAEKQLFRRR